MNNSNETVLISGAGPVGCLAAAYLSKRGYKIEIFESRADSRHESIAQGRSINLALSNRAFDSLAKTSPKIVEDLHKNGIKMFGRYVHLKDGSESYQPYGKKDQYILSVGRRYLNEYLVSFVEQLPNVKIHFSEKTLDVNLEEPSIVTTNFRQGVKGKFLVGADGINSVLRKKLQDSPHARLEYQQHFMTHSYKELFLPPNKDGEFALRSDCLHIWPRHDFMLIALPNPDKDFTVTLFLREKTDLSFSPYSFENLDTDQKVVAFLNTEFPSFVKMVPNLLEVWHENPKSPLMWLKLAPHHYKDKAIMIGDAAHAIIPFYGQGVNCGFEDCKVLGQMFDQFGDDHLATVFEEYSTLRKPSTDAICELSEHNFTEMSSSTASTSFVLKKKFGLFLHKLFSTRFLPLYTMVTFTPSVSYAEAISTHKKREERIGYFADLLVKSVLAVGVGAGVWYAHDYYVNNDFHLFNKDK